MIALSDDELVQELRKDPFIRRFELEAEIEERFAAVTAVCEDAPTAPVVMPLSIRVGTDLSWVLP